MSEHTMPGTAHLPGPHDHDDLMTLLDDELAAEELVNEGTVDGALVDEPIPYTVVAPSWVELSQAEEYAGYDAAIPFYVVRAYTAWAAATADHEVADEVSLDAAWDAAGYAPLDGRLDAADTWADQR